MSRITSCFILLFALANLFFISSAETSITENLSTNLTTLRLVQIITRHGDRAPLRPYPNDIYKNASVYSINGWGELSVIGEKQVYELGAYLRRRYNGFLPRQYQKKDFYILSSNVDRAIMSAESNLAGLYELGPNMPTRDIFKEWQPVPIHTIPVEEDNLIYGKASCPRYEAIYQDFLRSNNIKNFLNDNKALIDFVADNAGLSEPNKNIKKVLQVQDVLFCQHLHNLTLPEWVNGSVFETLNHLKAQAFAWATGNEDLKRLKSGPLLKRILDEMRAKVEAANLILDDGNNDDDDDDDDDKDSSYKRAGSYRKIYAYSGHDTTISAILNSLNLFQPHLPPYAAALIIELHKEIETGQHFIQIFYRNDATTEPNRMDLTPLGCESAKYCSYKIFSNFIQKFIPNDWKSECQLDFNDTSSSSVLGVSSERKDGHFETSSKIFLYSAATHKPGMMTHGLSGLLLVLAAIMGLLTSVAFVTEMFKLFFIHSQRRCVNSEYDFV